MIILEYKAPFLPIREVSEKYVVNIHDFIDCEQTYHAVLLNHDDRHNNYG